MKFDWSEYLKLAKSLTGKGIAYREEAAFRCATSKAYFAAFCAVRNYAIAHLRFTPEISYSDHGRLRRHLKDMRLRNIADSLNDLRNWRNDCDYEDEVGNLKQLSCQAISAAEEVFRTVDQLNK